MTAAPWLGVAAGDFVSLDPCNALTPDGHINSHCLKQDRHAILLEVARGAD